MFSKLSIVLLSNALDSCTISYAQIMLHKFNIFFLIIAS